VGEALKPEYAAGYADRWRLVAEVERRELRGESLDVKLRQVEALAGAVDALGWRQELEAGDAEVRELWRRLRAAVGG
jgi:hypothetical protein